MAVATPIALPTTSGAVTSRPCSYIGFSLRNTSTTTTALVELYDGPDTTGVLFETISLAPSESARESYPNPEIRRSGIYASITGTVVGCLRIG